MFKLNIECTKDIDELHINFSDGSSVVTTKPVSDSPKEPKKSEQKTSQPRTPSSHQSQTLDLDADFGGISQEVIKPPEINREEREVKVAEELQNFDF
jgi:hypothetical protein